MWCTSHVARVALLFEPTHKSQWIGQIGLDGRFGSAPLNSGGFTQLSVYGVHSKLWVANIDPTQVATADVYTQIRLIVEFLNKGVSPAQHGSYMEATQRQTCIQWMLPWTIVATKLPSPRASAWRVILPRAKRNAFLPTLCLRRLKI